MLHLHIDPEEPNLSPPSHQTCMLMPPHLKWSPPSCFAGATVCFKSIRKNAIEDPKMVPVRLNVRAQEMKRHIPHLHLSKYSTMITLVNPAPDL